MLIIFRDTRDHLEELISILNCHCLYQAVMMDWWKCGTTSKRDVCFRWRDTSITCVRPSSTTNCLGSCRLAMIRPWESGITRAGLVSTSSPDIRIMSCAPNSIIRRISSSQHRLILLSGFGTSLCSGRNSPKPKIWATSLEFRLNVSKCWMDTREAWIGFASIPLTISSHPAQMTERSSCGNTQIRWLGNIQLSQVIKTMFPAWYSTAKRTLSSPILKIKHSKYGTMKQKHRSAMRRGRTIDIGFWGYLRMEICWEQVTIMAIRFGNWIKHHWVHWL